MIDPEHQRRMNRASLLATPLGEVLNILERAPRHRVATLHDEYMQIGHWLTQRPGGLTPSRKRLLELVLDFAWFTSDRVTYWRERERFARRKIPAFARDLHAVRARGEVPVPVDGIHVAIGFRFNAKSATRAAFIAVPWRAPYAEYSFAALAGLNVEILATAVDTPEVNELALELELQGVRRVQFRRIDGDFPPALLFDAGHSFLYRRWSSGVYG